MDHVASNHNENLEDESSLSGSLLDTKTGQIDDILNEKLEEAICNPSPNLVLHDVAKIATEYDPIDLAHAVTRLPTSFRPIVYENLPDLPAKIIFLINTGSNTRLAIFRHIDDQEIKKLIEMMPPDEAVSILDDMSDRRLKRVLDLLEPKKAYRIRELQKHDRHSAGRLMTNEFFAFPMHTMTGKVTSQIRDNPGIDLISRIFVLNDEGELIGFVPSRTLLVNSSSIPLRQIMQPILHKVTADDSRDDVVDLMERYKIPALPVVDKQDRLLGVISYEDAVEAMIDLADETIANIAGTAETADEQEPIFKRFLWRAPWLLVTLFAGLFTATVMTHFKDRAWFIFVPFFVPLITGMSGNVGIQCSTILVRGMSNGEISIGSRREAFLKELVIGLLIGVVFGLCCGLIVYWLNSLGINQLGTYPLAVGTIVSFGVFGACLTATVLGSFFPFIFARFRIDPAVASGPIVTAFNDVLSTLMYFLIASVISSFFF